MSQENASAVVAASIDAYNRGDLDAQMATYLPTAAAVIHADAERLLPGMQERTEGRAAIRNLVSEMREAWLPRYEPTEVRVANESTVVCRGRIGGVGASTGLTMLQEMSVVFALRDGLIERVEFVESHAEALRALGLEE
jgi:ketosteroid isomerase-like protein